MVSPRGAVRASHNIEAIRMGGKFKFQILGIIENLMRIPQKITQNPLLIQE